MNLARLTEEVRRRTDLLPHEGKMIRFAADRFALALGYRSSNRCFPESYLLLPEERASIVEQKCADLTARHRRQILTLLNRLFSRAARLDLVDGLERIVDATNLVARPIKPDVEYPFVRPDGSLPDGVTLEDVEAALFSFVGLAALRTSSSQAEAARKLGLKKTAFHTRLVKHGIYQ